MSSIEQINMQRLRENVIRLRGNLEQAPEASIIIPVNAQGDLQAVLVPVNDIAQYTGTHTAEIILVINNYAPSEVPPEVEQFRDLGLRIVAIPSARRKGEVVIVSARALGVQAAESKITLHFDADCRIHHINPFLDWYISKLNSGFNLAYSRVDFYDFDNTLSVRFRIVLHHLIRWFKRTVMGIPTTRGSNYAIDRATFLQLYAAGKLSVDLQVGPAAKLAGAKIVYSAHPNLRVSTSGRKLHGGWMRLVRYLRYRLYYNLNATPTRKRDVTSSSWEGFDHESGRREIIELPKPSETSSSDR